MARRGHRCGQLVAALIGLCLFLAAPAASAAPRLTSIVIDHASGEVLNENGADRLNQPASLTKMMTLYMLFDALDSGRLRLDSRLKVSQRAAGMPPSKLGLAAGSTIGVQDAIRALTVRSANDVAVVVAEALAGSEPEFARRMTRKAQALGLRQTVFRNASGLPDRQQVTTARDMALLARRLILDHPRRYGYFGLTAHTHRGRSYATTNHLLKTYRGMDGLKTGYVRASGFNLASSAERDGRRLVAVVLGGKTAQARNAAMVQILDAGFRTPRRAPLVARAVPPPGAIRPPVPAPRADAPVLTAATAAAAGTMTAMVTVAPSDLGQGAETAPVPRLNPMRAVGDWAIQVGAFGARDRAMRVARQASELLPQLLGQARIESPRSQARRDLFLARLAGLEREIAESACRALEARSIDCLVVRSG